MNLNKVFKYAEKIFINAILFFLSIFLCFIIIGIALRSGYFDNLENPHPVWIPRKYKEIDKKINLQNTIKSKKFTWIQR
jgi:hypothetical protein